ncbi:IS4 family transposase [Streptomyces sp. NPDC001982]|uniref:IS4 family transposase n=1 Tax=Streptomyces sp. NPDC001982 TaxID=3154405 RepID=UPI003328C01F
MTQRNVVARPLAEWISLGLLAGSVPRDVIDEAVAACDRAPKRAGGKLPPHVMVYFAMALALYADDDYEEVITRLTATLAGWGCWDQRWEVPTKGGITQARQRLGGQVMAEVFDQVARPVAELLTRGAWLGHRRLVSIDGFEWDMPDSPANAETFGYAGGSATPSAFPKARVVTLTESGTHASIGAAIGPISGKGSGEQSLARELYPRLEEDHLLLADRNFYSFTDWCQAADTGAALLWRVTATLTLPVLQMLPDGSYRSVVVSPEVKNTARTRLIEAARRGGDLDPDQARYVRVVEYEVPDRGVEADPELICLITTLTDLTDAPALDLAQAYHQRWEHEQANDQIKTRLRGPGRILRSKSPDLVQQEIYGYLLTHYAISALISRAATAADIDPDRVKFMRTVRIIRRQVTADPAAFPP